jgi:hypothetical protein
LFEVSSALGRLAVCVSKVLDERDEEWGDGNLNINFFQEKVDCDLCTFLNFLSLLSKVPRRNGNFSKQSKKELIFFFFNIDVINLCRQSLM